MIKRICDKCDKEIDDIDFRCDVITVKIKQYSAVMGKDIRTQAVPEKKDYQICEECFKKFELNKPELKI